MMSYNERCEHNVIDGFQYEENRNILNFFFDKKWLWKWVHVELPILSDTHDGSK